MVDRLIREIASAWNAAAVPIVFTGAGMSTESGLPDFRSKQGLWKQRPESLATLAAMSQTPDEFYFFYQWRIQKLWEVEPNAGHLALVLLETEGRLKHLITQNVDGLHHRAGSIHVSELHGTLKTVSCLKCRNHFESRQLLPKREGWEGDYQNGNYHHGTECQCPQCEGGLRPDVVFFGESLPEDVWNTSREWSCKADLFVVIGSSLSVSPANYLPQMAVECGAKLLIINQEATPLDQVATWRLWDKAAEALPVIAAAMKYNSAQENNDS